MKKNCRTLIQFLLPALCIISLIGCISIPGKDLPRYTIKQIDKKQEKVTIEYNVICEVGAQTPQLIFQKEIRKTLIKSNLFSSIGQGAGNEKYHFTFTVNHLCGNPGGTLVSAVFCGLTCFLTPMHRRDDYYLTVDVLKDNSLIKQYKYNQRSDTWCEFFLIFAMGAYSKNGKFGRESSIQDLIMAFLYDLQQDRLMDL